MAKLQFSQAVAQALLEEMRRDERLLIWGEDVHRFGGVYACTKGIPEEFPDRIFGTPISEAAYVGAAMGAAVTGTPVCAELQYVDFILCAMDQLINQTAKTHYMSNGKVNVPVTLRVQQGFGRGNGAQHAGNFETYFCATPGLKVVCPSNAYDAKGLLKTALRDPNPVVFCEHKLLYPNKCEVPEEDYTIPFGKANIVREGTDITIVATSFMVGRAKEAAEILEKEGISAEVIDPRTLVPLDIDAIVKSVEKTGRLIVSHEAVEFCGVGGEIGMQVMDRAFKYLDAPIKRMCTPNFPFPYNKKLEASLVPSGEQIAQCARELCNKA